MELGRIIAQAQKLLISAPKLKLLPTALHRGVKWPILVRWGYANAITVVPQCVIFKNLNYQNMKLKTISHLFPYFLWFKGIFA